VIYAVRLVLVAVYTVIWGVIGMCVAPFSGDAVLWVGRHWIGWIFSTCGLRVEAEGLEKIAPAHPCVFMSNHQSVLDIGALVLTIPVNWRFVLKKELLWVPFFGWVLALSDQIVIDRGRRERAVASLRRAAQRIRAGASVIIFPEGTRSLTGELREFKSGGFHLAIEAQVPIVPATVSGSFELIPKHSLRIRSGTMKIVYGDPIPTQGLTGDDRGALKDRVRAAIQQGFDWDYQGRPEASRERGDSAVALSH
jgi:1-acyl-sn-glycerol-3-phosphate acyltransferase